MFSNKSHISLAIDRSEITAGKKPARAFNLTVSIDERAQDVQPKKFEVNVVADQTLAEFEEDVLNRYTIDLSNYALILMGNEVKDDHALLVDLGITALWFGNENCKKISGGEGKAWEAVAAAISKS